MSRRDKIHEAVVEALEKELWIIFANALTIRTGGVNLEIDLGARKTVFAQREDKEIAVEVKTFGKKSKINEFHGTVGQYVNYRGALKDEEMEMDLYLAISEETWTILSTTQFYINRLRENNIKLIIVNVHQKRTVLWINNWKNIKI